MYYILSKNEPYYSTLMSLTLLGLYPKSADPISVNISSAITFGLVIFALLICNVGGLWHLFVAFKRGSKGAGGEMSEDLAVATGGLGFLMCVSLYKFRWRRWTELLLSITDFKTYGKPKDFDKIKDRCNLLSFGYSVYIAGGMTVYAGTSLLESSCATDKDKFCGTLTNMYFPIDVDIPRDIIKIIFILQLVVCMWACVGTANLFFLTLESTEFMICHMNSLKQKINQIFQYEDERSRKRELGFCVRYHNYIIDRCDELNNLTKICLGHMSLIAAVVMGMIGNQVVQQYKPLGAGLYLGGYVLSIFWISHAGQRIWDQSLSISDSIYYDSKWYVCSSEIRKDLSFMVFKAQDPLVISSLPLGTFNYALFLTMLKAAYSYLTLLQQSAADPEEK